jgi:hypothetical protein
MSAIEDLISVLCDPEGNVCIQGSDADRAIIQKALKALSTSQLDGDREAWGNLRDYIRHYCVIIHPEKNTEGEEPEKVILDSLDALQRATSLQQQSVDVEALKQIALEGVMKGREHSKDLRYLAFEIISESFNHMNMLGHFHGSGTDYLDRIVTQKKRFTDQEFGDKELADLGAAVYDIITEYEGTKR